MVIARFFRRGIVQRIGGIFLDCSSKVATTNIIRQSPTVTFDTWYSQQQLTRFPDQKTRQAITFPLNKPNIVWSHCVTLFLWKKKILSESFLAVVCYYFFSFYSTQPSKKHFFTIFYVVNFYVMKIFLLSFLYLYKKWLKKLWSRWTLVVFFYETWWHNRTLQLLDQ